MACDAVPYPTSGGGELPPGVPSELRPAVDCLRLLDRLRLELPDTPALAPEGPRPPAAIPPNRLNGEVPFGRFSLRRELGRGGFGVVFLAFDPLLRREVAIKLPRPEGLLNAERCRRFVLEGRAAAALEHPNILPVLEAGEVNGISYITSPYNPGPSLSRWLRGRPAPVPPAAAAHLLARLADGVDHAHQRGVIHRDLKPANVLLAPAGPLASGPEAPFSATEADLLADRLTPKITDFGLAKLLDGQGDDTRTGALLGTPRYSAPEQVEGRRADIGPAADVYALGVILYEMLTLTTPFAASSDLELLRRISGDDAPSPRRHRPDLPCDLESICLKCLDRRPRGRYATAGELAADLRRYLRGEPVTARLPSLWEQGVAWARRRPAEAALCATVLLALAGLGLAGLWHYRQMEAKNLQLQAKVDEANEQREIARARAAETRRLGYTAHIRLARELMLNGQVGLMAEVLNRERPLPDEEDLREFSWRYLWGQARNDLWLRGHQFPIEAVAVPPQGDYIASASADRTVRIWDRETGLLQATLAGFEREPHSLAVFPYGSSIVAINKTEVGWGRKNGAAEVRVWGRDGRQLALLRDTAEAASAAVVSPDGRTVAFGRVNTDGRGAVCLWQPSAGTKRFLLPSAGVATALAYSPDGQTLAAATRTLLTEAGRIVVLDAARGEPKKAWDAHTRMIDSIAFTPDGALLTGSWDGTARLWAVSSGAQEALVYEGKHPVRQVACSADGKTLAVLAEVPPRQCALHLLDRATGKPRREPYEPFHAFFSFALNADASEVVQGRNDHVVRVWRPWPAPAQRSLAAHTHEVWGVAFGPDSRTLVTSSDDHLLKVLDVTTGAERHVLKGHGSLVSCVAMTADGRMLASGSYDNTVRLWRVADGAPVATLEGHTANVRAVAFSPCGGLVASGGRDHVVRLWDAASARPLGVLACPDMLHTRGVAFSPDGAVLASVGIDRAVRLWDVAGRVLIREARDAQGVWAVAFSPDGKMLATGGADGTPKLWDRETLRPRGVIGGHDAGVGGVAFSPDGRTLASAGNDRTVRLWHVETGHELCCFKGLTHQANAVAFSPDGGWLAAALHDGKVMLWQAPRGR